MATRPRLQPSAASFRLMPLCSRIAQRPDAGGGRRRRRAAAKRLQGALQPIVSPLPLNAIDGGQPAQSSPTRSSSDSSAPWANVSEYVSGPSASTVAAMALRRQKPAFAGLLEEPAAVIPRTED